MKYKTIKAIEKSKPRVLLILTLKLYIMPAICKPNGCYLLYPNKNSKQLLPFKCTFCQFVLC